MKKFLSALAFLIITSPLFAHESDNFAPTRAEMTFAKLYLNVAQPEWKKFNGYDIAIFYLNGNKMKVFFDADGNLYSTVKILTNKKELSDKLIERINNKFPGFGMTQLILESGKENEAYYYANITDGSTKKVIKFNEASKIEEVEIGEGN